MFGLFKSPTCSDPLLGELRYSGGMWRGTIAIGHSEIPLAIHGSRASPDKQALELAQTVASRYPEWQTPIASALYEHYEPYADSVAAGEADQPEGDLPRITQPAEVWSHTSIEFISVAPLDGGICVEIGYRTAWDEEHIVGARMRDGQLIELNGSVLPP